MFLTQRATLLFAALTTCAAAAPVAGQPALVLSCTNPASGTTWQISIDFERATVDSYPARISDSTVSWHDAKDGGNYTLDRRSGALTVVIASSTGGYFLHHRCLLPP